MHDLHCHILPGVDDGAQSMEESLAMLEAAQAAGVTSLTATPHCRDPYYDVAGMTRAFLAFQEASGGFPMRMGFEVNHHKLMEIGLMWADRLCVNGTNLLLLELSVGAFPSRYDAYMRTIFELQGMGLEVVIAHPERYLAIQQDIGLAEELVNMGCRLQVSTDFIAGGRLGSSRRPAIRLLKAGLVSYLASDAHTPEHYELFGKAYRRYGGYLV